MGLPSALTAGPGNVSQAWPVSISLSPALGGSEVGNETKAGLTRHPSLREPECPGRREASVPVGHLVPRGLNQQRMEPAQVLVEEKRPPTRPVTTWTQLAGNF